MTSNDTIRSMPQDAFAALAGADRLLKALRSEDVHTLFPQAPDLQPGLSLWALLSATGQPIMWRPTPRPRRLPARTRTTSRR